MPLLGGDRGRFSVSQKKKETENRPLSPIRVQMVRDTPH